MCGFSFWHLFFVFVFMCLLCVLFFNFMLQLPQIDCRHQFPWFFILPLWSDRLCDCVKKSFFIVLVLEWPHPRGMPSNRLISVHHQVWADFGVFLHRYAWEVLDETFFNRSHHKFPFHSSFSCVTFSGIGNNNKKFVASWCRPVFFPANNCDCCTEIGIAKRSKSRWIPVDNTDSSIVAE